MHTLEGGGSLAAPDPREGPYPQAPRYLDYNRPVDPLRPDISVFFETQWEYNADARSTAIIICPNDNREEFDYDDANPDRRSHGNVMERRLLPGPLGSEDQEMMISESFEYDDRALKAGSGRINLTRSESRSKLGPSSSEIPREAHSNH